MKTRFFRKKISLEEALSLAISHTPDLGEETVSIENALNRVLAEDVISEIDNPPFDRAMMDGYALLAEDTFGASPSNPLSLKLVGDLSAGASRRLTVKRGEAIKIMTGAQMPEGANAVLKIEYTEELNDRVNIFDSITPGKNISKAGEDLKRGEVILNKGRILRPQDVGVLAATGKVKVLVKKRPRIMIVSTGAELVQPGKPLNPGEIYDINTFSIYSLVETFGGIPLKSDIIKDDEKELEKLLKSSEWDIFLVSGATSVGEKDFVPEVVEKHGRIVFHGVSIRPGEPVGFGIVKERPVFMLPGFPVASVSAFELLVGPFILKSQGRKISSIHNVIEGVLEESVPSHLGRVDFVRVGVENVDGIFKITPIAAKGAGLISTLTKSQGFLLVDGKSEGMEAGEKVKVFLF